MYGFGGGEEKQCGIEVFLYVAESKGRSHQGPLQRIFENWTEAEARILSS
jgi:hypothetical protein